MAQFRIDTNKYLADSTTLFEVMQLADKYGNLIGGANPSGMAVDAFGRMRVSNPQTLFESFHRYHDNGKWSTANSATANVVLNTNASLMNLNIDTTSGAYAYRETNRVFAYQPGKSLQIFESFVFNPAQANLVQRIGYFGSDNGLYLEQANTTISLVKRSSSNGTLVETRVPQSQWNMDTLLGNVNSSPSHITLDLTKTQILFTDIEWLGVGTVRQGFVIDGQLIHCHSWNHANNLDNTYMTTACLPVRQEIFNIGTTAANSTLKCICSTVISEGGYASRSSRQRTLGQDPANTISMATAGTYYPLVSIRLNPVHLDGIVVPRNISVLPTSQGNYRYKLIQGATINGAVWTDFASDSVVQYNANTSATLTGGTTITSGYVPVTAQATGVINLDPDLFRFQLERNSFTSTPTTFTLAITSDGATDTAVGSMDWEEIT